MGRTGYDHVTQSDYEAIRGPDWPTWPAWCQDQPVPDFVLTEVEAMLSRPVAFDHPSFCVLPFYAREFWAGSNQPGRETFCCLVPDGSDRAQVKAAMLKGQRPTDCAACWHLEDQGLVSDRMIKNRAIDDQVLDDIQAQLSGKSQRLPIHHYKLDTSNVCNGTCVVCDSTYSSAWAQLERNHGREPRPTWRLDQATLDLSIDYDTARSVGFRGGEPLLSDATWQVIQRLLAAGRRDCALNFTTNGSITLSPEQTHLLRQFTTVGFNFSIDGVGPVFEYLRYPLKWTTLLDNIEHCRESGFLITASYTITNLNILYHGQTHEWFHEQGIAYSINPVRHPRHFRPGALPWSAKQHMLAQADPITQALLGTHDPQDDLDYLEFRDRIAEQDGWKGLCWHEHLPELAGLLG